MPISRIPALLILLLIGASAPAFAGGPKREFIKTINREFSTTANGMTALYNKYGKVTVNTWNNNSVKIDITIVVNADDQRTADRTFERINVNFTNTAGYVKAETFIGDEGWWPGGGSCQDFKINYEVWMPIGNQLDLKNKYGNSYVGPLNGKLFAEIKYGDLRTEAIGADADLYLGYGKAYLARVNNLYGQISYGELTVPEARDLQLDTKYSDMNVERAAGVRITSKYDDFTFGTLDDLRLQTKYANVRANSARAMLITAQYTDVKLGNLADKLDADLTYGALVIDAVGRGFSDINVTGKYTNVKLYVERGAAYRFEAEGNYTEIHPPSGATMRQREDTGAWESARGYVGDANAKGLVRVKLSYGDFVIK